MLVFFIYKGYQIHRDVKQVMTYRTLVREVLAEEDTGTKTRQIVLCQFDWIVHFAT